MPEEITFQNDPVDPSVEFRKQHNHFFLAERAERVEPDRAAGEVAWKRVSLAQRVSYHQVTLQFEDYAVWRDMPEHEYADERACPFELEFVSPRCVRVRLAIRPTGLGDGDSIMLDGYRPGEAWEREDDTERCTWRSEHGSISIRRDPFGIELRDAAGRVMTRTLHLDESPSVVNVNPMGHPLLRPLFFEFPGDPGSWLVEDQYLLGTDLLVAPLFENVSERRVYLPPGRWHRFAEDEGTALDGPGWHALAVEEVPAVVLVQDGASPRLAEPAQHTGELDWEGAREWHPAGR
jgi:Glycosyl hydrolases family 31